eukprot:UN00266
MNKFVLFAFVLIAIFATMTTARQSFSGRRFRHGAINAPVYVNVTSAQLYDVIEKKDTSLYIIDVREEDEFAELHIATQINGWNVPVFNMPLSSLADTVKLLPNKKMTFVVHCKGGVRSLRAINEFLAPAGKYELYNLEKGFDEWKNQGFPVEAGKTPIKCPYAAAAANRQVESSTSSSDYELALEAMGLSRN